MLGKYFLLLSSMLKTVVLFNFLREHFFSGCIDVRKAALGHFYEDLLIEMQYHIHSYVFIGV